MAKTTKEAQETKEIRRYIKLTFIEPVLGTWPSNENVARDFIASKARMRARLRMRSQR